MKTCSKCSTSKPVSDFYKTGAQCKPCVRKKQNEYGARNRERNRARTAAWAATFPEKKKASGWKQMLKQYNLTPETYNAMLEAQGGVCKLCDQTCPSGKRLAVDHDHACCPGTAHSCGRCVRGLLCIICNRKIAALEDWPWRARAEEYLTIGALAR